MMRFAPSQWRRVWGPLLLLTGLIGAFVYFQFLRIEQPGRSYFRNYKQAYGDFQYTIDDALGRVRQRLEGKSPERFIFNQHNPGFFLAVPYFVLDWLPVTPKGYLYFVLFLGCISIVLHYLWFRQLTGDAAAAGYGALFLVSCPFFLSFAISFFAEPWDFLFLPLSMLLYLKAIRTGRRLWFAATWLCYALLCASYYMYVVSAFVMFATMNVVETGRIRWRWQLLLGLAPISIMLVVLAELSAIHDFKYAVQRIAGTAVWRISGADPQGSLGVQSLAVWVENFNGWLELVKARMSIYYFYPLTVWLFLAGAFVFLSPKKEIWRSITLVTGGLIAGFSWLFLMRQHTAIHDFTGGYSYFYWMMLYACFFATCRRTLSSVGGAYAKFGVLLVDLCAVFFLMPILNQYLLNDFAALMDLR